MKILYIAIILFFLLNSCASTINVEYPVFSNTKQGRQLQSFLGKIKNVGIIIEKPKKFLGIFERNPELQDQIAAKVFDEFSKESYYKLIDISKRAEITNEATFSLTGLTQNRLKLGKLLSAEAFLYVRSRTPTYECKTEMKQNYLAIASNLLSALSDKEDRTSIPEVLPAKVVSILIPLEVTLVKVETGEILKSVVTDTYKLSSKPGILICPSTVEAFSKALKIAVKKVRSELSPTVKTEKIKVFRKYKANEEVQELLEEGYLEITGENPSYKRAFEQWSEADKKSNGKSWEALSNIATYYYAQGDFKSAIEHYEKAMKVKPISKSKKNYIRNLRKKVEANSRVEDESK